MSFVPASRTYDAQAAGANCDVCPLSGQHVSRPTLVKHPRLTIISDAPGEGRSREILSRTLEVEGIPEHSVNFTSAVLCRPAYNTTLDDWKLALECCRPRLAKELQTKTVLALGEKAQQTLSGKANLMDWMGPPTKGAVWKTNGKIWKPLKTKPEPPDDAIRFDQIEFVSTVHPAFCLHEPGYTPILRKHTRRAWLRATGKLGDWAWPEEYIDDDSRTVTALKHILASATEVGVDLETNMDSRNRRILNVGIASAGHAVSVSWQTASAEIKNLVVQILAKAEIAKVFWNMAFDIPILEAAGFPVNGVCEDWMLAKMVIAPRISNKLTHASCFEFSVSRWKTNFRANKKLGLDPFESADPKERALYNARDTWVTLLLGEPYRKYLARTHRGEELYANAKANTRIAMEMSRTGVKINRENLKARRADCETALAKSTKALVEICRQVGHPDFNPRSHKQRQELFRTTLGVQTAFNKKGKFSLDKKALEDLCAHDDPRVRAVSRAMLDARSAKRKLDYINALDADYVFPSWRPGKAITGRWASSEPNLMNIPKPVKDPKTKEVIDPGLRVLFDAREGCWLVECDYQALEARTLAHLAGDTLLLEWFETGVDIHTRTAAVALQKTDAEVTADEREIAKSLRYAFHYGSTPETAWKAAVIKLPKLTLRLVEILFAGLTKLHPNIMRRNEQCVITAKETDYVECPITGRRHWFHGQVDANQCKNLENQMGGSGLIDAAMRRLQPLLEPGERILMQVHDSLVCEGPDPHKLAAKMKAELERPVLFRGRLISFPIDTKIGRNWGKMSKFEV